MSAHVGMGPPAARAGVAARRVRGGARCLTLAAVLATAGSAIASPPSTPPEAPVPLEVSVRPGSTLSGILARHGFGAGQVLALLGSGDEAWRLERLRPGQTLEIHRDRAGRLVELALRLDAEHTWRYTRDGDGFGAHLESAELERRIATASATVDSSLYVAARRAGLSHAVILSLAGVFEWDVDLARDLRRGDRFSVIYEELYLDGRKVRDGHVLAAELTNRGRTWRAVRYTDPKGRAAYYTPGGESAQKAFLRSPVEFARVSSRFSRARRHPVLNTIRAHRGVDYAADPGTPVRATADGRIVSAGRNGGYGNTVVLAHGGQYSTLYAHLSRFARGVRAGGRVRQGQVIGYVGSTGLATGPHLHYEFRVRGVHRDALTVELPKGRPVPAEYRPHFLQVTSRLSGRLARLGNLELADAR